MFSFLFSAQSLNQKALKLSALPYSVDEIYTIDMFEGSHIFVPLYKRKILKNLPDIVVTEDTNNMKIF